MKRCPVLVIPDELWDRVGTADPAHYMLATVEISLTFFHVEAFAFAETDEPLETAQRDKVRDVVLAFSDDKFSTVRIGAFDYVIIITPFDR